MFQIHHLALTAKNLSTTSEFYDEILNLFGYNRHKSSETVCSWHPKKQDMPEFLIYAAKKDQINREHCLYNPGVHHFCFSVDEKNMVDEVFEVAKRLNAEILDTPAEYPRYAGHVGATNYYAVFFNDPNNIKLEFAWMPKAD